MENGNESVYPTEEWVDGGHPMLDDVKVMTKGITKREYFAAMALRGLCANEMIKGFKSSRVARKAVKAADLLLKELEYPKVTQ